LPQANVNEGDERNKVDTIGWDLEIEIKKAVKGDGNEAAQSADPKKKPQRVMAVTQSLHFGEALSQKNDETRQNG
jgi:hypothetical protein